MKTEVEELLYFSIPGFFIEFLFLIFLFFMGKTTLISSDVGVILVVAAIPAGYILYQAYTSLPFYGYVWTKGFSAEDSSFELIGKMIDEKTLELGEELRTKVRESISRTYLFNFFTFSSQDTETIEYSWRLVNLINGRAVGIFSCLLGLFIPWLLVLYDYATSYISTLPKISLVLEELLQVVVLYYALLIIFIFILALKISHLKTILNRHNQGIIVSKLDKLDELIWGYVALNTVQAVDDLLVSKKKATPSVCKSLDEGYGELKAKHWKKAMSKANEIYENILAT